MNLEKLRETHMLQEVIVWLQKHMKTVKYADQDGINAIMSRNCISLDPRLNKAKKSTKDAYVLHYPGEYRKPWSWSGVSITTRSGISSLPYLLFRQTTPVNKEWWSVLLLLLSQTSSQVLRICANRIPLMKSLYEAYQKRERRIDLPTDQTNASVVD